MQSDFDPHAQTDLSNEPAIASTDARLPEDFESLEISDLPPTRRSHHLLLKIMALRSLLLGRHRARQRQKPPLHARQRRQRVGNAVLVSAMLVLLVGLLFSASPALRDRALGLFAPTPSPTGVFSQIALNQIVIISSSHLTPEPIGPFSLAAVPNHCPAISSQLNFSDPSNPPGIGNGPVWVSGFSGEYAVLDNLQPLLANTGQGSLPLWYETLTLFLQRNFTGTLTLQETTQQQPYVHMSLGKADASNLTFNQTFNLNDGNAYTRNGAWEMTAVTLTVPRAGCYFLRAFWAGHSWQEAFAAGA